MVSNFTPLCWGMEAPHPYRVRLVVYCAPGHAVTAAAWLGGRVLTGRAAYTGEPARILEFLRAVEADQRFIGLVERYVELTAGGRAVSKAHREEQTGVVRQILEMAMCGRTGHR